MPLYTDALVADTTNLSALEFGVYMLLLTAMWRAGGTLPNSDVDLRRIGRISANNWPKVRDRVMRLLTVEGDHVTQKRLREEFEKASGRRARRVEAGRKGGAARAGKTITAGEGNVLPLGEEIVLPQRFSHLDDKSLKTLQAAQALLAPGLKQKGGIAALNHIHEPIEEREAIASPKTEGIAAAAKPRRGTRLAEDWKPLAGDVAFATGKGCSPARIEREAEAFRNYWLAKAGAGGTKLDWSATWRNWILTALDRRPEPKASSGGTGGWDLPAWGAGGPKQ
jgi:uncharacterized protein YdaU (DUF1376 family)